MQILNAMHLPLRGYGALIPQTRLKPYLDSIGLTLDATWNFSLDFAGMDAANDAVFEVRRVG